MAKLVFETVLNPRWIIEMRSTSVSPDSHIAYSPEWPLVEPTNAPAARLPPSRQVRNNGHRRKNSPRLINRIVNADLWKMTALCLRGRRNIRVSPRGHFEETNQPDANYRYAKVQLIKPSHADEKTHGIRNATICRWIMPTAGASWVTLIASLFVRSDIDKYA